MTNQIFIESVNNIPTFKKRFEIVERKGIGHPDTICDLVMNQISVDLSKLYLKETGAIQHHNMDKALLVAGQSESNFGGGKIIKPIKMILGDRATFDVDGKRLPIGEIAINSAKRWFEKNIRFVNEEHVKYQIEIGVTSKELSSIFENPSSFAANDTSVLVGYAPFTETESIVLNTEQHINSKQFKDDFPESGEDVKVMGFRDTNHVDLTIATAFVDRFVSSENQYFQKKEEMLQEIDGFLKKNYDMKITAKMNCLDSKNKGLSGLYLTVLGTSAEGADSGQVGRGNMASRVISPSRPAGSEATAGKNPISHIGKIYNALSFKIANEIHTKVSGLDEVCVWMYNVIGSPVNKPRAVIVQPIITGQLGNTEKNQINEIVEKNLENIQEFCNELISGKYPIA
ncbi:methionine adenosyltransferase [Candidatus Nitrosarchaeum limnium]|uniref:Methionine adenosyltransferase n=1 Tax=Candidatus Nitrosarchaeum limnium BG20 TaxID=859192 RepID=S2DZZ5_9ARCH|nr:methionine adenosyltransferase [Candidatus Nitrosarchaeum limnium]EPA04675.1 methionine adenosyltransferase [Candidatus Nitrosarchaeum limnium BG20]